MIGRITRLAYSASTAILISTPAPFPRVEADALIVQNARTFFVGNAPVVSDVDGQGFSKRWFNVAKETWGDVRNVDSLLEGIQPVPGTAMLYSVATRSALDAQNRPVDFRRSTVGALESMTYTGRPVESLAEFRLTAEELAKYEALILPEVDVLSDAQAETDSRLGEAGRHAGLKLQVRTVG